MRPETNPLTKKPPVGRGPQAVFAQLAEKTFSASWLRFQNSQKISKTFNFIRAGHPPGLISAPSAAVSRRERSETPCGAAGDDAQKLAVQRHLPVLAARCAAYKGWCADPVRIHPGWTSGASYGWPSPDWRSPRPACGGTPESACCPGWPSPSSAGGSGSAASPR